MILPHFVKLITVNGITIFKSANNLSSFTQSVSNYYKTCNFSENASVCRVHTKAVCTSVTFEREILLSKSP